MASKPVKYPQLQCSAPLVQASVYGRTLRNGRNRRVMVLKKPTNICNLCFGSFFGGAYNIIILI